MKYNETDRERELDRYSPEHDVDVIDEDSNECLNDDVEALNEESPEEDD